VAAAESSSFITLGRETHSVGACGDVASAGDRAAHAAGAALHVVAGVVCALRGQHLHAGGGLEGQAS